MESAHKISIDASTGSVRKRAPQALSFGMLTYILHSTRMREKIKEVHIADTRMQMTNKNGQLVTILLAATTTATTATAALMLTPIIARTAAWGP